MWLDLSWCMHIAYVQLECDASGNDNDNRNDYSE